MYEREQLYINILARPCVCITRASICYMQGRKEEREEEEEDGEILGINRLVCAARALRASRIAMRVMMRSLLSLSVSLAARCFRLRLSLRSLLVLSCALARPFLDINCLFLALSTRFRSRLLINITSRVRPCRAEIYIGGAQ